MSIQAFGILPKVTEVDGLSGPLTTDYAADASIRQVRDKSSDIPVIIVNELLVRGNLPAATRLVQQFLSV